MKIGYKWLTTTSAPHAIKVGTVDEITVTEKILDGGWKLPVPVNYIWWEDMKLLDADGYWEMEGLIRFSKWRAV
jgi:hypothetical protein